MTGVGTEDIVCPWRVRSGQTEGNTATASLHQVPVPWSRRSLHSLLLGHLKPYASNNSTSSFILNGSFLAIMYLVPNIGDRHGYELVLIFLST